MNDNTADYISGAALLASWGCITREQKLEQAVKSLMAVLNEKHIEEHGQCLLEHLSDPDVFCSCAEAYRMGHEALKL